MSRLPPPSSSSVTFSGLAQSLREAVTPTLRLGVTGLSRSGKTVFITALVRNLMAGGRLPFFLPEAEGRLISAVIEPQPDDVLPRFDYEAHLAALGQTPPQWPESTRRIAQLRLTLTYQPSDLWRRSLGLSRLHVDIVDYPGEWLIDLSLIDKSFAEWSAEAFAQARRPDRAGIAGAWLAHAARAVEPDAADDPEQAAIEGARLFTAYLEAAKAEGRGVCALTPGRFLMPGDLAGSPLLTFFPFSPGGAASRETRALAALLERRFESYKREVVQPFFKNHFQRLDRQVVLVDVLGALSRGQQTVQELEEALTQVLSAFRPGGASWLARLFTRRIDRVLFAATKADHLSRVSHDRLEAILMHMTERAAGRVSHAGGDVRVMALSALRATREAEVRKGGETLACICGVPLPGEVIAGTTFDGTREAVIFPGDLPEDPKAALAGSGSGLPGTAATFVRFRPPQIGPPTPGGELPSAPHIRLDRALDYLIGDWLP